jgi:hypothetical protein
MCAATGIMAKKRSHCRFSRFQMTSLGLHIDELIGNHCITLALSNDVCQAILLGEKV